MHAQYQIEQVSTRWQRGRQGKRCRESSIMLE
jgi:hypothetical protein